MNCRRCHAPARMLLCTHCARLLLAHKKVSTHALAPAYPAAAFFTFPQRVLQPRLASAGRGFSHSGSPGSTRPAASNADNLAISAATAAAAQL